MERKTLGSFLAALRKASGMTQKDLAEKLNVTDKSVSRWEREESLPDLALIPVIAEIFDITSDELLRGERRPAGEPEERPSGKMTKQRQRVINVAKARYRNQSLIALGVGFVGLLAAMACNFGLLRANIGFFVGAVFYLAAFVCQAIFVNGAILATKDEDLTGPDVERFKGTIFTWAAWVFGVLTVLLPVTLPLILLVEDAHWGISLDSWLGYALVFGGIAALLCAVACYFLRDKLLKNGTLTLPEAAHAVYRFNHKLKGRCAAVLVVVLLVSAFLDSAMTGFGDPKLLAEGITFDNFRDFGNYMKQDVEDPGWGDGHAVAPQQAVPMVPEEDDSWRVHKITGEDGAVIFSYVWRNEAVGRIVFPGEDQGYLPITVYTKEEIYFAEQQMKLTHAAFYVIYLLEAAGALAFYFKKRKK